MKRSEQHDIEARTPVWIALSYLFLDTDVTLSDEYIVRVCAQSPYSLDELFDILQNEVAPVCRHNLLLICGEWDFFDEAWLIKKVTRVYNKRYRWFYKWLTIFQPEYLQAIFQPEYLQAIVQPEYLQDHLNRHWARLSPLIQQARETSAD